MFFVWLIARGGLVESFLKESVARFGVVLAVIFALVFIAYALACSKGAHLVRVRGVIWGLFLFVSAAVLGVTADLVGTFLTTAWLSLIVWLLSVACAAAAAIIISCSLDGTAVIVQRSKIEKKGKG